MSEPSDLRSRKKLATYRALAHAARELTAERGLEAVTVDDIAAAADVSPRTFFNYFSSKEQAIVGVEPAVLEDLAASLLERPREERPIEAVAAVLLERMTTDAETARRWLLRAELVERYPSLLPRHLAAMADIERTLVTTLAQRMDVDADHDLRPMVVVSAVTALQRSTLAWWNRGGRTEPLGDALRSAFAALATELATP